jgi:hypothetical protein
VTPRQLTTALEDRNNIAMVAINNHRAKWMLEKSTKTADERTIVVTDLASATQGDEYKQDIGIDNRSDNETETATRG